MVAIDIGADDIDLLIRFVLRLGGYAEGLFDYHDFGFPKDLMKGHITQVEEDLRQMRESIRGPSVNLRPPNIAQDAVWEDGDETWNYGQTLRFAAGATMISEKYRPRMNPENLRRALIAKILHKCQAGILDDLVDQGKYTFIEAKDLYHHCFASMIDPDFDINTFRKELALILKQEQLSMFDLVTNITAAFNRLHQESPNGPDLFYEMERVDDRVILGQALTMFQKHPSFDLGKLKRISSGFWAPDPDVKWHERLASYVSGATYYNLIDMCFLTEPISKSEMNATLKGWYYYDLIIAHLNHYVGLHKDLRAGIANLALIGMREQDVLSLSSLHGYNPNLTVRDYEEHFARTAEFSRRAIANAMKGQEDLNMFHPFITIMIPVVMLADWIGNRDTMIHAYLRTVSPAIRDAVRNNGHVDVPVAESATSRAT